MNVEVDETEEGTLEDIQITPDLIMSISDSVGIKLTPTQTELFSELFKLMKEIPRETIDYEFIKKWIKTAKQDLAASRMLFATDKANSIYHLQQSIEKTAKAYGLALNIVKKTDLKKINHVSPLVFINLLHESWVIKALTILKKMHPALETDFTKLEKLLKKQEVLARIDENSISALINVHSKSIEAIETMKENKPAVENILQNSLISSFIAIYLLSMISFPHEAYTRYPKIIESDILNIKRPYENLVEEDLEPEDYDDSIGIVKMHNKICMILDEAIEDLNEHIEENSIESPKSDASN